MKCEKKDPRNVIGSCLLVICEQSRLVVFTQVDSTLETVLWNQDLDGVLPHKQNVSLFVEDAILEEDL